MKAPLSICFTFLFATNVFAAGASITGTIKFEGDTPKFKEIKMDADPICSAQHKEPVFPQSLLLGAGNTMGNVLVQVKNPPKGTYAVPSDVIIVDQKGCNYNPHVIAAQVGQKVKILNPDGTLHNVHAVSKINPEFNLAMPKFRTEVEKSWDKAESNFTLKCDVHPWMTSWISIMDNPFYAVTKDDGKFELKDLPDGTYEVVAWHEKLGTKSMSVTITGGAAQIADFTFAAPKKN